MNEQEKKQLLENLEQYKKMFERFDRISTTARAEANDCKSKIEEIYYKIAIADGDYKNYLS